MLVLASVISAEDMVVLCPQLIKKPTFETYVDVRDICAIRVALAYDDRAKFEAAMGSDSARKFFKHVEEQFLNRSMSVYCNCFSYLNMLLLFFRSGYPASTD